MRGLTRPVAFLLTFVLLQLLLVESGYACAMPMEGAAATATMAGMQMPASTDGSRPVPAQPDGPESPCQFPWAPNGCHGGAPCAVSALTVTAAPSTGISPTRVAPIARLLSAPQACASAPELPPPRA